MFNLLPPELESQIKKEYRLRFFTLSLLFVACAIIVGVVALLPYTFSFGANYLLLKEEAAHVVAPTPEDKDTSEKIKSFKDALTVLDPNKVNEPELFSDLVNIITLQKSHEVSIQNLSFAHDASGQHVTVSGVSATREALVTFSKQLSGNPLFSNVDLPISNLNKKTDIDFSISLTLTEPKK